MIPTLLAIAVLVILLIVVITGQPDEFKVARSAAVAAAPEKVFAHVNELRKWEDWSPWAKLDPDAKSTFEGPESGVGSAMSWSGNRKVGEGKMTITESTPASFIQFRLEFLRPFKATNTAEFEFAPRGKQTLVTWTMLGTNNFIGKVFSLFFNCDTMVGKDFEKGLASLKSIVETRN